MMKEIKELCNPGAFKSYIVGWAFSALKFKSEYAPFALQRDEDV